MISTKCLNFPNISPVFFVIRSVKPFHQATISSFVEKDKLAL